MSEYWKSTGKYWCKYCSVFVTDNKICRKKHEESDKHKQKTSDFIKSIKKTPKLSDLELLRSGKSDSSSKPETFYSAPIQVVKKREVVEIEAGPSDWSLVKEKIIPIDEDEIDLDASKVSKDFIFLEKSVDSITTANADDSISPVAVFKKRKVVDRKERVKD